jgi:hypothetical protein
VTYTAQWKQVTTPPTYYTVRFVDWDGTLLKTQQVAYGGSATAPSDPTRVGYTFTGWDRAYSYITSNITVTAKYVPLASPTPTPTPTPGPTPTPTPTPEPTPSPTPVPIEIIGNRETPLYSGTSGKRAWSLVNLILAILGAILGLFTIIRAALRKDEAVEKRYQTTEEAEYKKRKLGWIIITAIMGILGVVVFILTEDMRLPMRYVDWWTIVNVIIFLVGILGGSLSFYREWDKRDGTPEWPANRSVPGASRSVS